MSPYFLSVILWFYETPFPHSQNCVAFSYDIQNKSEKKFSCYDDAYMYLTVKTLSILLETSILSDCLHEIYRYYEILGEEQYELHTRWLWRRLWKGIISLSSKSTAILTAIMSNSASHFGAEMALLGRGELFPWHCPPPPQIYSLKRHCTFALFFRCSLFLCETFLGLWIHLSTLH